MLNLVQVTKVQFKVFKQKKEILLDYLTERSIIRYDFGYDQIYVPKNIARNFTLSLSKLCLSLDQLHFHLKSFLLAARWQQQDHITSVQSPEGPVTSLLLWKQKMLRNYSLWPGLEPLFISCFFLIQSLRQKNLWLSLVGLGTQGHSGVRHGSAPLIHQRLGVGVRQFLQR